MITQLDADLLRNMFFSGLKEIKNNVKKLNDINVFSVSDCDTGTNMEQTLEAAVRAVAGKSYKNAGDFVNDFARGSLLGARGNSGVILSQYIRGFAKSLEGKRTVSIRDFSVAMIKGVERAFESVVKPIDGTILSVMRDAYIYVTKNSARMDCFELLLHGLVENVRNSVEETPNKLDILKYSRVVDSGAAGFLCLMQGMEHAVRGEVVSCSYLISDDAVEERREIFGPDSVLETGYCTEFMLQLQSSKVNIDRFNIKEITDLLESVGDSVVVVKDDDIIRAHFHSFTPGKIIDKCREYGEYISIKIENMSVQHNETLVVKELEKYSQRLEHKITAVIGILPGDGLCQMYQDMGCDLVLSGKITEHSFSEAFDNMPADHYIIISCNEEDAKAAADAAWVRQSLDVHIINSDTIPKSFAALRSLDLTKDIDTTVRTMNDAAESVCSGLVAKAGKDANIDNVKVKAGHYVGALDDMIVVDCDDKLETCIKLVERAEEEGMAKHVTVFYGGKVLGREMELLKTALASSFKNTEFEYICDASAVYDFIFAIR